MSIFNGILSVTNIEVRSSIYGQLVSFLPSVFKALYKRVTETDLPPLTKSCKTNKRKHLNHNFEFNPIMADKFAFHSLWEVFNFNISKFRGICSDNYIPYNKPGLVFLWNLLLYNSLVKQISNFGKKKKKNKNHSFILCFVLNVFSIFYSLNFLSVTSKQHWEVFFI